MKNKHRTFSFAIAAVVLFALGTIGLWSIQTGSRPLPRHGGWDQKPLAGLDDFGTVPAFSLTERSGKPVTLRDLGGQIWIANFIYTACTETCPLQSAAMAKLQSHLSNRDTKEKVKLVSISVDPERDTPALLSRYADRFGADPDRWLFLTGQKDAIVQLAQQGFRLSVAAVSNSTQSDVDGFIHSSRLVLVDGQAKIRGYYQSNENQTLQQLAQDIKLLLSQQKAHG